MLQLYGLYKETGKLKEAEEVIKQLIKLKNDNKYRSLYADDLLNQQRYDEALAVAGEIEKSDPMNVDGLMLKGRIQGLQNKLEDAIETFKMVSFVNENYAPADYERGEIYRNKQTSNARNLSIGKPCRPTPSTPWLNLDWRACQRHKIKPPNTRPFEPRKSPGSGQ